MKIEFYDIEERFDPNRVITTAEIMDKNGNFTDNGLYSEKIFGTISGEEIEYSCLCGETHGKLMEGYVCPKCNTEVYGKQSILSRMAWIDLGEYKVINGRLMPFLHSYFGTSRLNRYLYNPYPIDSNGLVMEAQVSTGKTKDPMPQCIGMGVESFIENFDSILEYFHSSVNKGTKEDIYDFIIAHRKYLFISKIPVFTPRLRPIVIKGDKVITYPMNEKYVQIIKLNAGLRSLKYDRTDMVVFSYINKIQILLEDIDASVILALNGKKGLIRNTVLGSRLNFSARCVLTPLPTGTSIEEIYLPYVSVLELFKLEVLNYLRTKYSINFFSAMTIFSQATVVFNKEIYDFMMSMIGDGIDILLNRNPTISIGSILCMKLTRVKDNIHDLTLSCRPNILKFLNADHDGDVLNVYRLVLDGHKESFRKLSPKNFVFNMNDGNFNKNLGFSKDYVLGLQTLLG